MNKMSGLFLMILIVLPASRTLAEDKPPKTKTERGIERLYNDTEHLFSSEAKTLQVARQTGGYRDEGIAFSVFTTQINGTLPLYRYFDPDTGDNALAALPERIKTFEAVGYLRQEMLGYVHASPQSNTRPLYELLVGETDMFYTADPGEFNNVTGSVPGSYVGIACWVNGPAKAGQIAAVPATSTQAPSSKGRALVLDQRTDLLSWSGAQHIRQNDFYQYWGLEEPNYAVLASKVPLAGKEAVSIRLTGRSRSANVVSFQYAGLTPDKPVEISFDWLIDFSTPETANSWFKLWVANGWKTPNANTWEAGNSMVRGIDSEGRWSGSSTGGWKHVSLVPLKADAEGKVTVSFELQNWEVHWANGREAGLANLSVKTASDTPNGNIMQNGDFSAGAAFWSIWLNPDSTAKSLRKSVQKGVLTVATANGGEGPWAVVANNSRIFKVEEGEVYRLTFEAWADSPRSLLFQLCENGKDSDGDGNEWSPHCGSLFQLGTTRTRYSALLVIKGRPDGAPLPRVIDPETQAWFEYGGSSVAVQLAAVSLERVTDPALVKQAREQ